MIRDFMSPVNVLDTIFGDFKPAMKTFDGVFGGYPVDVKETETSYDFAMNVPGFKKEDIDISINNGVMTVKSEKKEETEKTEDNGRYILKERSSSSFSRAFRIPENADINKIEAKMEDGILNIVLPKAEKKDESSKIEIK